MLATACKLPLDEASVVMARAAPPVDLEAHASPRQACQRGGGYNAVPPSWSH